MPDQPTVTTLFFTDLEGSSRLWEVNPEGMKPAMAQHEALLRRAVIEHRGEVVKMTGDGICAAFVDPLDAVRAALTIQLALEDPAATYGVELRVRCGIHVGVVERRDNDYYGNPVNRAARIMSAAHGGQVLVTQAVMDLIAGRLPAEVSLHDLGGIRLRDLGGVEHLYQVVHPKLRRDFPALRSLAATPNNLPQQVTSFVGREPELAQAKKMLERARLLTLCGAGGIGKTRLSLELAAGVLDDFPDGVSLVELAPLTDGRLVTQAVASAVGVKESAGRSIGEALVNHVAERDMLLIFDNCEHLLDSCAELAAELLKRARGLRIVASSRERLRVPGEVVFPLPSLAVPDVGQATEGETLTRYESVRLFVERAKAASGSFSLNAQNRDAVVRICRHLDGIPLAIELAAARTRALSVETIAERIGDRFRLFGSRSTRTTLPRQQTLRALSDWSYDLLNDAERAIFRRVAVFAGSFALDAAESVCEGDGIEKVDVLDLVAELVEKSLIVAEPEGQRYRMLETLRSYARERLVETTQSHAVEAKHLHFYLALAERAAVGLSTPDQASWLAALDLERENLVAAHAYAETTDNGAEMACRLVVALKAYWFTRGLLNLAHRMTEVALAIPDHNPQTLVRCRALWAAGQISSFMGSYQAAQEVLRESLDIAERLRDDRMIAGIENVLALASLGLGDRSMARQHCERALQIARRLGNKLTIIVGSNALAQLLRLDGELTEAGELYRQAIALARELREEAFVAIGLLGLAMVEIGRRDVVGSASLLRDALAIARSTGSQPALQSVVEVSAGLASLRGEFDGCARLHGAAEAQTLRTGVRRDPADEAFLAPWVEQARQALGTRFDESASAAKARAFDVVLAELDGWLASAVTGNG